MADELDADVANPAGIPAEVAAGRVLPRRDHFGISGRRLHHRAENSGHDFRGRRFFVAGLDAFDPFLRPKFDGPALSLDDSHRANDAGPIVVRLHSSDRRGRRGRRGIDHAAAHAADDFERAHSRIEGCASPARRHGRAGGPPRMRFADEVRTDRIRRDYRDDVGAPHVQADSRARAPGCFPISSRRCW